MADVKLTKNELRLQEMQLKQLKRYLPTLQLKKSMLQVEVQNAKSYIKSLQKTRQDRYEHVEGYARLFPEMDFPSIEQAIKIEEVVTGSENIAGVEVPIFQAVKFLPLKYHLSDSPIWMESAVDGLHKLIEINQEIKVAEERLKALENELRDVSIRVNLFEKILIPRAIKNIKKIKVFLGDQQLAAVAQAKVAKSKIEEQKEIACA